MFFEGSEKKLEIVLHPRAPTLRTRPERWERVVARANASILSFMRTGTCDAYLLSESSLFVFDHRLIMITCGITSLISAVEEILHFLSLTDIRMFLYERKNERDPGAQPTRFDEDVRQLRQYLPGGEVSRFGGQNEKRLFLFHYFNHFQPGTHERTLELLMHDLAPNKGALFRSSSAAELYKQTRIHKLFEGFRYDHYLFDPMGYSLNALRDNRYFTFHVTPQPACSYAGFGTNHLVDEDPARTITRVLDIFQPQNFALVLFGEVDAGWDRPEGYRLDEETTAGMAPGYSIRFRDYSRFSPGRAHSSTLAEARP